MPMPDPRELLKKAKKDIVKAKNENLLKTYHDTIKTLFESGEYKLKEIHDFLIGNNIDIGFNPLRDYINEHIKQKEDDVEETEDAKAPFSSGEVMGDSTPESVAIKQQHHGAAAGVNK